MCHSCWLSALLSAAPTVAFTTLLTQCTPYLPLVPTVLPTTFTNPSLPHPPEVPNFHLNLHTWIARYLSSAPLPPQVPSRAFWRYNIYWLLESYYIIMTDILWLDLHEYMCYCSYDVALCPPNCICLLPHSIWNARHAWTLYLTFQIIMILHHLEPKPIKSAHWTCKHEVCSTVYHLHNMPTDTAFERHKVRKKFFDLLNPPRHGSHGRLEEDERYVFKQARYVTLPDSWPQHLFEILAKTAEKRDVIDVVRLFLPCATHVDWRASRKLTRGPWLNWLRWSI